MSFIDWLNPFKSAWWWRDEWVRQGRETCVEIVEEHDCPSWDVRTVRVEWYKNKHTCEERLKKRVVFPWEDTVFEDPRENDVEILGTERRWVGEFDLYDGGKYE